MKSGLLPKIYREFRCGATTALYVQDPASGRLGLWLVPTSRRRALVARREFLSGIEIDGIKGTAANGPVAWAIESLLQLKAQGDDAAPAFSQGRSMRNSPTVDRMKLVAQTVTRGGGRATVRTTFAHPDG